MGKILLLLLLNCQFLIGQEINEALFSDLEEKFLQNESVNLDFLFFDCPEISLQSKESLSIINTVYQYLKENPKISIELRVHTDCRGRDDYNKKLSQRRAENLKDLFIRKGLLKNRIFAFGFGGTKPLVKCIDCKCDWTEHDKNRRLEIVKIE